MQESSSNSFLCLTSILLSLSVLQKERRLSFSFLIFSLTVTNHFSPCSSVAIFCFLSCSSTFCLFFQCLLEWRICKFRGLLLSCAVVGEHFFTRQVLKISLLPGANADIYSVTLLLPYCISSPLILLSMDILVYICLTIDSFKNLRHYLMNE